MIKLKNIFKNRNNFMKEISTKIIKEVSSGDTSTADEGESDTMFLGPGEVRKLGVNISKPEPWFERGGYTQTSFPSADDMIDEDDDSQAQFRVVKKVSKTGVKYTGFQDDIGGWDKWGHKDFSTDFDFEDLLKMYS